MAFHIKNPETDALARKVAALRQVGLTEAVHQALEAELERHGEKPSLVDEIRSMTRELRANAGPNGLPADKAFIDSLYESD